MSDSERSADRALAQRLRGAVLGTTIALNVLITIWLLSGGFSAIRIALSVVITAPLWFATPRLNAGVRRAYAWTTLAVIPCFVLALTEAVANPSARTWAGVCLLLAFTLFVLLIAYLRVTRVTEVT